MRTIIQAFVITQMIAAAAGVPSYPVSSPLHNTRHEEGGSTNGEASTSKVRSPIKVDKAYSNCVPQRQGQGPQPGEDTPAAFRRFEHFHDASNSAMTPRGYKLAKRDLDGAIENDPGFLGTQALKHYDPDVCATYCNDLPTCASFNLYFERDPIYEPNTTAGCPNPPSTTTINCALWHSHLGADAALNFGEIREEFHVLIGGSNLYNKIHGPLDLSGLGFSGPRVDVDNDAAFLVPDEPTGHYSTLLDQKLLFYSYYDASAALDRYDPTACAHLCSNITNAATPAFPFINNTYPVCSMFVAYELRHNGPLAMVCELYSSVWSSHYQSLRGVVAFGGEVERTVILQPTRVSVYQRSDYQYSPICAMAEYCGKDFYAGGDCSGWGQGYC